MSEGSVATTGKRWAEVYRDGAVPDAWSGDAFAVVEPDADSSGFEVIVANALAGAVDQREVARMTRGCAPAGTAGGGGFRLLRPIRHRTTGAADLMTIRIRAALVEARTSLVTRRGITSHGERLPPATPTRWGWRIGSSAGRCSHAAAAAGADRSVTAQIKS